MASKGDNSIENRVVSDCPEGTVLNLILWNLVVEELLEEIEREGWTVVGYPDTLKKCLNTLTHIT